MKKVMLMAVLVLGFAGFSSANCGSNGNGNGNGCSGNTGNGGGSNGSTGPQGPVGPQGPTGSNGSNGVNGSNGSNGANGTNGTNGVNGAVGAQGPVGPAAPVRAAMLGGLELRLLDFHYVSLMAFDDYQLDPLPSHDIIGGGAHNYSYGARLVIKLGSSYEERRLAEQQKEIDSLRAMLLKK